MTSRRSRYTPDGGSGPKAGTARPPRAGAPGERVAALVAVALFGLGLTAMSGLLGDDVRCRTIQTEGPTGIVVETRTECPPPTLDNGFLLACLLASVAVYVPRYVLPEVLSAMRYMPENSQLKAGPDGVEAGRQSPAAPGDEALAQTDQAIGQLAEPAAPHVPEDRPAVKRR